MKGPVTLGAVLLVIVAIAAAPRGFAAGPHGIVSGK